MGDKPTAVTLHGTFGYSVPIPGPAGRGLHPGLTLSYSSGAGNTPYGLGWSLGLPSIARRTDRRLPRYLDDDRFVTGGDDLVPVGAADPAAAPLGGTGESTRCFSYRPRTEGEFARIERHVSQVTGDVFWITVSPANVLTVYGRSASARIADPADPRRVVEWLAEDVFDDRGNRISYRYVADDDRNVDMSLPHEVHRRGLPTAQRYLKEVGYGNRTPVLARFAAKPLDESDPAWRDFCFRIVLDYGDHAHGSVAPDQDWTARADSFSTYRAGFEVRTRRLLHRAMVFHDFPGEPGPQPRLVQALALDHEPNPVAATLRRVTAIGYADDGTAEELPYLEFDYSRWQPGDVMRSLADGSAEGRPSGLRPPAQWADLDGDGAAGLLMPGQEAWLYASNLGQGKLTSPRPLLERPLVGADGPGRRGSTDVAAIFGDGRLALVEQDGTSARYSVRDPETLQWAGPQAFRQVPAVALSDPNARSIDLDGDGLADLLVSITDEVVWHRFGGESGWDPERRSQQAPDDAVLLAGAEQSVLVADMTGDGLEDIVRVLNGAVCFWPNLGYGSFGRRVTMSGAPEFDRPGSFDARRVRLADLDGTGPSDLLYLGPEGVRCWRNLAGNAWSEPELLATLPVSELTTSVSIVDLLGHGTRCLVVSSDAPGELPMRYIDLMPEGKPYLLSGIDNGQGLRTQVAYATSTEYALRDRGAGRPWSTHLPVPVHLVATVTVTDEITGVSSATSYRYRDGYFDIGDREFRGFGYVEQIDADAARSFLAGPAGEWFEQRTELPPTVIVTEYATGSERQRLPSRPIADVLPEAGPDGRPAPRHELTRAIRGKVLRRSTFALDGTPESRFPYAATDYSYEVRIVDGAPRDRDGYQVTMVMPSETLARHIERAPVEDDLQYHDPDYLATLPPPPATAPEPPRVVHSFATRVNMFGQIEQGLDLAYGRQDAAALPEQRASQATVVESDYVNLMPDSAAHRLGVVVESRRFEVLNVPRPGVGQLDLASARALADAPVVGYSAAGVQAAVCRRKLGAARTLFWTDDVAAELPFGSVGSRALVRRSLATALDADRLRLLAPELDAAALRTGGGYVSAPDAGGEAVLWAQSAMAQPDPSRFFLPTAIVDPFGVATFTTYDGYGLMPIAVLVTTARPEDAAPDRREPAPAGPTWNRTTARYDYRTMAVREVTDPHGVVSSARYDALGALLGSTRRGPAGEGPPADEDEVRYIYRRDTWRGGQGPAWSETQTRETDEPATRWQRSRAYFGGSGTTVLTKTAVEPGDAPFYDAAGALVLAPSGRAAVRPSGPLRWLGSGRVIYDGKGRTIGQYDPYFAPEERYEDEAVLVRLGYPVLVVYDVAGRIVRRDFPDGSFDRVHTGTWTTLSEDRGDTVAGSAWALERAAAAAGSDEALASARSAAFAGTGIETRIDALGRTVALAQFTRTRADGTAGVGELRELVVRSEYDGPAGSPPSRTRGDWSSGAPPMTCSAVRLSSGTSTPGSRAWRPMCSVGRC